MNNPHQALEQLVQQLMKDYSDSGNQYLVPGTPHALIGPEASHVHYLCLADLLSQLLTLSRGTSTCKAIP